MELFLRKYLWTLNVAIILSCSYLAAGAVNNVIEAKFRASLHEQARSQPAPAPVEREAGPVAPEERQLSFNPFTGETYSDPVPMPQAAFEAPVEESSEVDPRSFTKETDCVETALSASLIGTIVAGRPEMSFARIRFSNAESTYVIGDELGGQARIVAIIRNRVFLDNRGKRECVSADFLKSQQKSQPVATAEPSGDGGKGVRQTGENEFLVSQEKLNATMGNLAELSTQARIVPSFKDGKPNGFRLYAIKPGSIFSDIGLKNGDVIQQVNGMELDTPERGLEIYQKLKESKNVQLGVLRQGKTMTLEYTIQ